jgi:pimeloyl-ACP methyl ester carboxylesterase
MKYLLYTVLGVFLFLLTTCSSEEINTAPTIDPQNFAIDENSANGTIVGQVQATDAENDPLHFKIVLGNSKFAFAIDSSSGQLTVNNKDALDYEKQNEFQLKVEIDDGEFKAQADVVVTLNNQETEFGNYNPRIYEKEGASLPYQIMYPYNYDEASEFPILFFLHGAGERGNDNRSQLKHGSSLFKDSILNYPCIVVFPQCAGDDLWANDWSGGSLDPTNPSIYLLESLIDSLLIHERVDKSRIYAAGLSMGGYGTAQLLAAYPDRFAAGVVICGGAPIEYYSAELQKTPTWIFHGLNDVVVPPQNSVDYFSAIDDGTGKHRLTLYEDVGHQSWDPAFAEQDFLSWIFSKSK